VRFLLAFFLFGFFFSEFGFGGSVDFLGFVIFFEFGAADECIGLDVIGGFLVFCLDELGRKSYDLVFAQFDIIARGLGIRTGCCGQLEWRSFVPWWIRAVSRKGRISRNAYVFVRGNGSSFRFRAGVGKNPAGKSTGKTARNITTNGAASRSRCGNGSAA